VAGYRAIRFDDLEDVPWKEGLTLRPVRSQLGLKAFGAAGFVGREPGDLVVEPHVRREAIAREPALRREAEGDAPLLS
jgi:hypothetical protein